MQEGNYKLVYIAGYGRSGSTLLDVILGMHPEIECNGELSYLFNIADDHEGRCDCGLELRECPKWKHVFRQLVDQGLEQGKEAERIMRSVEHVQNIWTWLFWPIVRLGRWGTYCQLMRGLFDAIYAAQNKPLLVDSSKSAYRCAGRVAALKCVCKFQVKVIHLVRDGRAVIWSHLRRPPLNRRRAVSVRVVFGWIFGNLLATLMGGMLLRRHEYLRVRYEDLMKNTAEELDRIGKFLGLDFSDISDQVVNNATVETRHSTGGNRGVKGSIVRIQPDLEWQARLPRMPRLLFWCWAWPLAWWYGYR